jgi:hypothetical protein
MQDIVKKDMVPNKQKCYTHTHACTLLSSGLPHQRGRDQKLPSAAHPHPAHPEVQALQRATRALCPHIEASRTAPRHTHTLARGNESNPAPLAVIMHSHTLAHLHDSQPVRVHMREWQGRRGSHRSPLLQDRSRRPRRNISTPGGPPAHHPCWGLCADHACHPCWGLRPDHAWNNNSASLPTLYSDSGTSLRRLLLRSFLNPGNASAGPTVVVEAAVTVTAATARCESSSRLEEPSSTLASFLTAE